MRQQRGWVVTPSHPAAGSRLSMLLPFTMMLALRCGSSVSLQLSTRRSHAQILGLYVRVGVGIAPRPRLLRVAALARLTPAFAGVM